MTTTTAELTNEQRIAYLNRTLNAAPPRDTQGQTAARSALMRAQTLTALVRDTGPDELGAYLDALDREQLYALTTTLAALVPIDVPVGDLLAWLTDLEANVA